MAQDLDGVPAAKITARGTIIAACITGLIGGAILLVNTWVSKPTPNPPRRSYIAGTVVDEGTNRGVPQALVTATGRGETYTTDDNGNFRLDFSGSVPDRVRIRVAKPSYRIHDESVSPPLENYIVQLKRE